MAKKSKIFKTKKEVEKSIQTSILESVAATVGAVGSSFIYTAVKSKIPDKMKKFGGVGLVTIGAGLNVFSKNTILKSLSLGISSSGGVHVINELAPEKIKAKIGLPFIVPPKKEKELGAVENEELENLTDEDLAQIEKEMGEANRSSADYENVSGVEDDDFIYDTDDVNSTEEIEDMDDM